PWEAAGFSSGAPLCAASSVDGSGEGDAEGDTEGDADAEGDASGEAWPAAESGSAPEFPQAAAVHRTSRGRTSLRPSLGEGCIGFLFSGGWRCPDSSGFQAGRCTSGGGCRPPGRARWNARAAGRPPRRTESPVRPVGRCPVSSGFQAVRCTSGGGCRPPGRARWNARAAGRPPRRTESPVRPVGRGPSGDRCGRAGRTGAHPGPGREGGRPSAAHALLAVLDVAGQAAEEGVVAGQGDGQVVPALGGAGGPGEGLLGAGGDPDLLLLLLSAPPGGVAPRGDGEDQLRVAVIAEDEAHLPVV